MTTSSHLNKKRIAAILSEIRAPYGVYASLGNHDKHNGPMEELIETIEAGNLQVLFDSSIQIHDNITIIGRRDQTNRDRKELNDLMTDVNEEQVVIVLEHQPYEMEIAQQNGVDVMLSGHTHRGQVFPGNVITRQIYENDWGLLQKGNFYSIVSSGFGFWGPPIRIGSRSEIVKIDISFD